jgi:hypothetical protein
MIARRWNYFIIDALCRERTWGQSVCPFFGANAHDVKGRSASQPIVVFAHIPLRFAVAL